MSDDITQYAVADTAALHVKDANNEPMYNSDGKARRIHLFGPGTRQYATVEARQSARAIKRMQDNDGKFTAASPQERAQETAEDLADLTSHFENIEYGDKQGRELHLATYSDPKIGFIPKQVTRFLAEWGNFKPGSAGS